jgi:hypothetical protein
VAQRKFPSPAPLTLALQAARINALSNWTASSDGKALVARGSVRPTALSALYTVRITYRIGQHPGVRVLHPPLRDRNGERPAHLYPHDELCLYHPKYGEWTPVDVLADTIIPWISEWIECYEVWLVTGEWLGGGEHPKKGKVVRNNDPFTARR